jgi:hypothetical protein
MGSSQKPEKRGTEIRSQRTQVVFHPAAGGAELGLGGRGESEVSNGHTAYGPPAYFREKSPAIPGGKPPRQLPAEWPPACTLQQYELPPESPLEIPLKMV